jgi:hypothetical protein
MDMVSPPVDVLQIFAGYGYHVLAFLATTSKAFLKQLLLSHHKRRRKG